jgi:hypothetical protein
MCVKVNKSWKNMQARAIKNLKVRSSAARASNLSVVDCHINIVTLEVSRIF